MEKPAPAAVPLTAVISTASMRAKVEIARCRSSATPLMCRPRLGDDANDLRSPPALKNRPEPVSTTTFVAEVSQRAATSASSRVIVLFMPFAASGRFRVIRAIGPDCSSVMVSYSPTPGLYLGRISAFICIWHAELSDVLTMKVKMAASRPRTSRHTEVERKFDVVESTVSPSFEGLSAVGRVERSPSQHLEAVYYDTPGHDLAAHRVTLRRRTGGSDAGWHLKLPAGPDTRTEVRAPLDGGVGGAVPDDLKDVVLAIVRDRPLGPVAEISTDRTVDVLYDPRGLADRRVQRRQGDRVCR